MLKKYSFLFVILALAFASLGCKVSFDIPVDEIAVGPIIKEAIQIEKPMTEVVDVSLVFGAGDMNLTPGTGPYLITGEAQYNAQEFKPIIQIQGNQVRLETGNFEIDGIPNFRNIKNLENRWNLSMTNTPVNLSLQAGAYTGNLELGGLSIKTLDITDGASEVNLRFSTPNLIKMDSFRYMTGASKVNLFGLGYANFASLIFRSGAGDYLLDFSGTLQQDSVVTLESGVSTVTIRVPIGTNAKVIFNGGLVTINASEAWKKDGNQYVLAGSGPNLTINVDMGAGTLILNSVE